MTEAEAEAARLKLIDVLLQTEQLLERCGEQHWPAALGASRQSIENRDFSGVDRLYSIFGGMGSFSDLTIDPVNGHAVAPAGVAPVNQQLASLSTEIYELVFALRHYFYSLGSGD